MAKRAWSKGWVGQLPLEVEMARAAALQAQSIELLRAENVVKALKTNAISLQNELARLRPAVRALGDGVLRDLDGLKQLPTEAAVKLLQRLSKINRDVSAVTYDAVELERLVAGEATSIVAHVAAPDVDLAEAEREFEALGRALRRAKASQQQAEEDAQLQELTGLTGAELEAMARAQGDGNGGN
jgi:hypothetical protein